MTAEVRYLGKLQAVGPRPKPLYIKACNFGPGEDSGNRRPIFKLIQAKTCGLSYVSSDHGNCEDPACICV